jgi:hypothetical protein
MLRFNNIPTHSESGTFNDPYIVTSNEMCIELFHYMLLNVYIGGIKVQYAEDTRNLSDDESILISVTKIKNTNFVSCVINFVSKEIDSYSQVSSDIKSSLEFYRNEAYKAGLTPTINISNEQTRIIKD